jgi:hypothetical protein
MIDDREKALEERRQEIIRMVNRVRVYQSIMVAVSGVAFAIILGLLLFPESLVSLISIIIPHASEKFTQNPQPLGILITLGYGSFSLIGALNLMSRLQSLHSDLYDIDNQLDLLRIPDRSPEQKAQKLLQMQQFELKRYYDQTLRQSNGIFYVGVITMILGFGVIAWSMYYVSHIASSSGGDGVAAQKWTGESGIVAVLGAIGGILTNFVGAMYIKMFSEIVQAVTKSHASLVTTSHLHLANVLAANIGTAELREKTLADLALALRIPPNALPGTAEPIKMQTP